MQIGQICTSKPGPFCVRNIESHWTHDFTRHFFGSLDLLYRNGFQSEIDSVNYGSDIDTSMIRLQFVYAWDRAIENLKKLGSE